MFPPKYPSWGNNHLYMAYKKYSDYISSANSEEDEYENINSNNDDEYGEEK